MMTTAALVAASVICMALGFALLFSARGSLERARCHMKNMDDLERALSDEEVVQVVQRMILYPYTANASTPRQKRLNQKHALLRARLRILVPNEQTRKSIYRFVKKKVK